jgi:hypothetical protein
VERNRKAGQTSPRVVAPTEDGGGRGGGGRGGGGRGGGRGGGGRGAEEEEEEEGKRYSFRNVMFCSEKTTDRPS